MTIVLDIKFRLLGGLNMRITIIGGGKVGYNIAENLADEDHDITVIDTNEAVIDKINEELDVLCIKGNGASVATLKSANIEKTDILIATTGRDEVNMIACLAGKNLGAKYTIARIRDYDYANEIKLLTKDLRIDLTINPESSTALQISRLMRFTSAADVEAFSHGRIELVGLWAREGDFFTNKPLSSLKNDQATKSILFCSVQHGGTTVIPNGSTVIYPGDKVFIIGNTIAINDFFRYLGRASQKIKNVMIVGGGRIATYLANMLMPLNVNIKIIEQNYNKCITLSEMFPKSIIIAGDGTDQGLLELENVAECDCFLALTGRDEDNIITSLYAKQQGAKKVIAKVNRQNYLSIINSLEIDSVVSPKLVTAYRIIRTVRGMLNSHGSKMLSLYKIAGGEAEAMEFTVSTNTHHLGTPLKDLSIKSGILLAVIIRNGRPIIPEGNDCIKQDDDLIIISRGHQIRDINDIYVS